MKTIHACLLIFPLLVLSGCQTGVVTPTLPDLYVVVKFVNNSGIASDRIHVAMSGLDPAKVTGYFDLTKDPVQYVRGASTDVPDVTLDTLISRGSINIPYVESGRIYFGVDNKMAGDPADFNSKSSSTGVIYDKVELTVMDTGNVTNLTQVDYFCMPMKLTVGSDSRGFVDGVSRKQIFDAYEASMASQWKDLVLKDASGTRLRILNPAKVAPADTANFAAIINYFDAVINEFWASGKNVTIKSNEDSSLKTGVADGAKIDFGADGNYIKPTSIQMFGQEVAAGSDAKIVKWVSCAVNRGVIDNPDLNDQGDSSKFYSASSAYSGGIYNRYAEFFHDPAYTIGSRAYALAFDDVFGLDSAMSVPNKGTVTITLQPFE